jgi:cysteine desulfurase
VSEARGRVAALIGAAVPGEIVFTAGGSESDSLAIWGTLRAYPEKKHLITSKVEHPAVLGLCRELEGRHGYAVTWLDVDASGGLDPEALRRALRPDTALVSLMAANNETGVIFPVEELGRIVKEAGAVFHVDAVQAAGKLPLNMRESTIDLLAISGHKLHGPKGVGALYVRKGLELPPFLLGGGQEGGLRSGTENVALIVGLGEACAMAADDVAAEAGRQAAVRDAV